jgi:hypothetical protein
VFGGSTTAAADKADLVQPESAVVERVVEKPVYVEKVKYVNRTVEVEKPIYVNRTVEVPVYIDRQI